MCLVTEQKEERDLTSKRVYKVLDWSVGGNLVTPYQRYLVETTRLKAKGAKVILRSHVTLNMVEGGYIHAFTSRTRAEKYATGCRGGVVVPGTALGNGYLGMDYSTDEIAVEEIELDYLPKKVETDNDV